MFGAEGWADAGFAEKEGEKVCVLLAEAVCDGMRHKKRINQSSFIAKKGKYAKLAGFTTE